MPIYAEVVDNKFKLDSLTMGSRYEIKRTEPNYFHHKGEPYVINDYGVMDFSFKMLCKLRYHRVR